MGAGALVLALSLATASTAFGTAANETSRVIAGVTSNQQSANPEKPAPTTLIAQVMTQTNTDSTATPAATPEDGGEQITINFDDDIKITVNDKLPQCLVGDVAGTNVQDALEECGNAQVGAGSALALVPGVGELTTTVSAFNGPTSVVGPACADPVSVPPAAAPSGGPDGCEFVGGNPTIVFHSRVDAPIANTLAFSGELQLINAGDVGRRLFVSDGPDVGGDAGAVILFNTGVNRSWTNGKKKNKKKTFHYLTATCSDANETYNFDATWLYDDNGPTDTDTHNQQCWNKVPAP